MKRILRCFPVLVFSLLVTQATLASSYQVEVVIFEHLSHDADGEISDTGLTLPDISSMVELADQLDTEQSQFRELSSGLYKLGGVYNELKFSRNYRPVYHIAWEQPQLGQSRAKYVHIRKADGAGSTGTLADPLIQIEGGIRIRSSQFLHADVDLNYFVSAVTESLLEYQSVNPAAVQSTPIRFAKLSETRRMKLNELHYFDHPVFGVILRVSRFN